MVASCFDKCMDRRYKDSELNVGENSCIDRCSQKYWQVRRESGAAAAPRK
jgi:import inner membrane translocase subunit TIM10